MVPLPLTPLSSWVPDFASHSWRSTLTPEDKTVTNKSAIFTVFGNSFKELRHFEQSLLSVNVEIVKFPKLICK